MILRPGTTSLLLSSVVLLAACGGGGSGSTTTTTSGATDTTGVPTGNTGDTVTANLATGRFVDSAVEGLSYQTATQTGTTDSDGSFSYVPGEEITFSIGDIVLPEIRAEALITPLTVFSTGNIGDPRVINLSRLLQTLDADGDAENGLTITGSAVASATGLSIDFGSSNFDNSVTNLVANSGSVNTQLIDGETALGHLQETLFVEGVMQRPQAPTTAPVADSGASATHPLVGTVRELTTRSHAVSGTVTILDDRTIEVSNFVYDGGGPSVFFYTGTDGNYTTSGGGRAIGEMLNGRVRNGETVILTLPDDVTLDDFNGLSVWCDIFNISFGDVAF